MKDFIQATLDILIPQNRSHAKLEVSKGYHQENKYDENILTKEEGFIRTTFCSVMLSFDVTHHIT